MRILKRPRDWLSFFGVICVCLFLATYPAQAQIWEYHVNDGEVGINLQKTSAEVDTFNHEIRLIKNMPGAVSFLDVGINDYVLLTPAGVTRYFYDGTQMQPSVIIPAAQLNNPVSIFTSSPYPDVIVGQGSSGNMETTHYSFDGSGMVNNPGQTITGLTQVSKVVSRTVDLSIIDQDKILYYGRDVNGNPIKIPSLSVESGTSNPIDVALFSDSYDSVFIDNTDIKYMKDGSITKALTGMEGAVSVSATNFVDAAGNAHKEVALVSDNKIKHYSIDAGGNWASNVALSVTAGLTKPTCVVLHPDSNNSLVVDGDNVKFYMYDGTQMVYNPSLSVTVAGLQNMGFYTFRGIAESKVYNAATNVLSVKLSATEVLETDTTIKWYVSATPDVADGSNWKLCTLSTWQAVDAGNTLRWKAILQTNDRERTPRIRPIIKLSINSSPDPPTPNIPNPAGGEYYLDSTPLIRWQFNDPDIPDGDAQSAYQVVVYTDPGQTNQILDTGKILGSVQSYTIDSIASGLLWNTGVSSFYVKIKNWDQSDLESGFSPLRSFGVRAFDRPRIIKTFNPLNENLQLIPIGMVSNNLPASKAGGMIVLEVDSIGITTGNGAFPYGATTSAMDPDNIFRVEGGFEAQVNKRWLINFYTDANTAICPNGTIVKGVLEGNGIPQLLLMQDNLASFGAEPNGSVANWWSWIGYRWWSEGTVQIIDSAFVNWCVVLEGHKL